MSNQTLAGNKSWLPLTFASVALLLVVGTEFILMALLKVLMAMFKHPSPLDDVSSLSRNKELLAVALIAIFTLSFPIRA